MSEVGEILRAKRQELGLSLSEASLSTKISPKVLNAIENGAKEALPALPFAKGFIRSYTLYLKLDPEEVLAQFLREIGDTSDISEAPKIDNAVSNAVDVTDDGGGGTRFLVIGGVVLLIALIVGIKSVIDKYQKEAAISEQVDVSVTPIEEKDDTEVDAEEDKPEATGDEAASDATEGQEAPAVLPMPSQSTTSSPPQPTTPPVAVPTPAPVAVPTTPAPVTSVPAPKPTPPVPVKAPTPVVAPVPPAQEAAKPEGAKPEVAKPEGESHEVIIEALDSVTVSAMIGEERKRIKLKAGEIHVLRASSKISMDISDGGAVNLTHNGRNRGVPGSLGQAKKVNFP